MSESIIIEEVKVNTNDAAIRWIGYAILFLTFGVFGVWAYYAPIDSAAVAPGVITVKFNSKTVQHLEGGIVAELLVQEGSRVAVSDVIIKLDDTQVRSQKEIILGQIYAAKILESRLLSEQLKQNKIVFSNDIIENNDARVINLIRIQKDIFGARRHAVEGEKSVLKQRIQQLNSKYSGLKAQKISSEELAASYLDEIDELKELLSEGFADKQHLREQQRLHTKMKSTIAEIVTELATIKIQVGETKLQIIQLSNKIHEEIVSQLAQVQLELFGLSEQLFSINDRLEHMLIRAPASGDVLNLTVHTEGGVIAPGEPILDIVPNNIELTITAQVSPIDIDRVKVGLEAEILFSAFNQATTPKLFGRVINLSPDRLINEQTGMPYYQAQLELTTDSLADLDGLKLLPGMPADVLISTGERTMLQYLSKPVTDAFARAFLED